jgi:hypothetical protein
MRKQQKPPEAQVSFFPASAGSLLGLVFNPKDGETVSSKTSAFLQTIELQSRRQHSLTRCKLLAIYDIGRPKETGWDGMDCTHQTRDKDQQQALMNMVLDL